MWRYRTRRSLGGSGVIAASNWRISSDPYRQIEVNRKGLDNSRKCLETRWRAHPVCPSSMQAKEKMYAHISVGRSVDIELKVIMCKTRSLCLLGVFNSSIGETRALLWFKPLTFYLAFTMDPLAQFTRIYRIGKLRGSQRRWRGQKMSLSQSICSQSAQPASISEY